MNSVPMKQKKDLRYNRSLSSSRPRPPPRDGNVPASPCVEQGMIHDRGQILLLARIMIAKHGRDAATVATRRGRQWAEAGDRETAGLWRAVGEAIVQWLAQPGRLPSLPEMLDGEVTAK